jgi:ureidoglycolate hydrolase
LKELRGLNVDVEPITTTSFTGDIVECLRAVIRVIVEGVATKYHDCKKLVDDVDARIAKALLHIK